VLALCHACRACKLIMKGNEAPTLRVSLSRLPRGSVLSQSWRSVSAATLCCFLLLRSQRLLLLFMWSILGQPLMNL